MTFPVRSSFLLTLLTVGLFFSFGLHHLTKFETTDEHFWKYERIPEYWQAIREHKWKKTAINDKPGISVTLISGSGLLFADPTEHRIRDASMTQDGALTIYDAGKTEAINLALRLPLLIINALLLLFIWYALKRTYDEWLALFTVLFIALSPILLGISQIMNPDTLLWSFGAAGFFSFLALLKTRERKFLFAAILGTALALLSKYTANILFPLYLAVLVGAAFWQNTDSEDILATFRRTLRSLLLIFLGTLIVFSFFLPAVFVKPELLWEGTLGFLHTMRILIPLAFFLFLLSLDVWVNKGRVLALSIGWFQKHLLLPSRFLLVLPFLFFGAVFLLGLGNQSIVPLETLMLDARSEGGLVFPLLQETQAVPAFLQKLFVAAYPFVFSLPPLVLFLILFLLLRYLFSKEATEKTFFFPVLLLSYFSLAYFATSLSAGVLTNSRYTILLYPLFAFLAAIGLRELGELVLSWGKKYFPHGTLPTAKNITLALFFVTLASLILTWWHTKPFAFNYTSPFLRSDFVIHDAWGLGLYEAAQYINSLPEREGKPILLWSDRNGICQFLTHARCLTGYRLDTMKTPPDYFVISKRGVERGYRAIDRETRAVLVNYETLSEDAVWRLDIGGRPDNFILVVPAKR